MLTFIFIYFCNELSLLFFQVAVAPQSQTEAELLVKEEEYDGTFKMDITISGQLSVKLRNKDTNETAVPLQAFDIREVFLLEDGFERLQTGVRYVMTGTYKCRCGIQQTVDLKKKALSVSEKQAKMPVEASKVTE